MVDLEWVRLPARRVHAPVGTQAHILVWVHAMSSTDRCMSGTHASGSNLSGAVHDWTRSSVAPSLLERLEGTVVVDLLVVPVAVPSR